MRSRVNRTRVVLLGLLTAAAVLVPAPVASAVTLNGHWAPFTRCPVDDPAMLATNGTVTIARCLAADSPSGSIKLGNTTALTGRSDLQFGLVEDRSTTTFTIIAPPDGAIVAAPAQVPGGLLGLMCPSDIPGVSAVCQQATDNDLNNVTAVVRPAGRPTEFDLGAGLITGRPILRLPVKIQLQNPLLGSTCFIGSDADPVVLRPQNLTGATSGAIEAFAGDGTVNSSGPLFRIAQHGMTQGDNSFAVPGASGCGVLGLLSPAINLKTGLPSPAGNNSLVLNDASSFLAGFNNPADGAPNEGEQLAGFWHSAMTS
jgi:hypothetical protein